MFFGKKDDKKLPDLPPPKITFGGTVLSPPDKEEDYESSSLPSFPDSPNHNRFSQAAIKDAVSNEYAREDQYEKKPKVVEMEEWRPSSFAGSEPEEEVAEEEGMGEEEEELEEPEFAKKNYKPFPKKEEQEDVRARTNDIFVKIDKFHSAKRSLNEIKDKLEEINVFIRKIREVKMREEQEVAAWEKDMAHIKSRIQNVTENIFEKIE